MAWPWQSTPRARPDLPVVLYTRHNCGLCEKALSILRTAQRAHAFPLDIIDIDSDPALVALYGRCVPVVTVSGKVRFRGKVNSVLLARLLEAGTDED